MLHMTNEQIETIKKKASIISANADELARNAEPVFGTREKEGKYAGFSAIAVPWCNMWLCIEVDGYCHT